ncbi:MAG: hypothetical protein IIW27_05225 [Clostridia bacterium]|nr:hypothetical protein [Clostridia bacterium]
MNQKTNKTIRTVYAYVLGASLLITAALIAYSAADIYFGASGGEIYTPAVVSARFSRIAWAVYFTLAAIAGGGVIGFFFPQTPEKLRVKAQPKDILARLTSAFGEENEQLTAMRKARKIFAIVCSAMLAFCAVCAVALVIAAKTNAKGETSAALSVLPVVAVALAVGVGYAYVNRAMLLKEIDYIKQSLIARKAQGATSLAKEEVSQGKGTTLLFARITVLAVGVILTTLGAVNGGAYDTFVKAVQICTQCIGLG